MELICISASFEQKIGMDKHFGGNGGNGENVYDFCLNLNVTGS